ncbi:MAG: hypothetical protein ABEI58_02780 [Candidatus Nanohaloarchaea archaeon]
MDIKDTLEPGLTVIIGGFGSILIGTVSDVPDAVANNLVALGFIVSALGVVVVLYPAFIDE